MYVEYVGSKLSFVEFTPEEFEAHLKIWVEGFRAIYLKHMASLPNVTPDEIRTKDGSRYVKVVKSRPGEKGGSVSAFIDKETGNVLKPASWKAPAKHARGNIFDASNGLDGVTQYGPAYLA